MTTTPSDVLVAVDGSPESDTAVAWAARASASRHAAATLMHVVSPVLVSWPVEPMFNLPEWYENSARHILDHAEETFESSWVGSVPARVHSVIAHDGVVPALAEASRNAELVVVGDRGLGAFGRLLLGSVSSGLLHHAHCPVAVVGTDDLAARSTHAPVLVGIDGSPASEAATALAFDEASRRGVDLVALHAWSDTGVYPLVGRDWHEFEDQGNELLAERLAGWQERYPDVRVHRRVLCDEPARRLAEESRHAQLVVVGSHGRGGFAGMLLGSTSSAIAQTSAAPVIVVRR